ncbi:MAG TPA: response regulator [Thermoanaerobaculia bacterium]
MHHRILVVEDDYAFRWALAVFLQRTNVEVDIAETGREAVAFLGRNAQDYCAVILDLSVPAPDGPALIRLIGNSYPALPVLVVTANADPMARVRDEACASVVKLVLTKPVDVKEVAVLAHSDCSRRPAASV